MRETCYHCLHADFKAEANGTMRGFARCTKAKTAEDKASYYFGGYKCDKGEFNPATADTMENGAKSLKNGATKGNENEKLVNREIGRCK